MALSLTRCQRIGSLGSFSGFALTTTDTNIRMDVDTERVGCKYFPATTSPITDIDVFIAPNGTVTDSNFKIQVETDSSDTPSGTLLGAATPEFSGNSSQGFIGLKTLATNTGNLTLNVPVWIVLFWSSGGSLSGTDFIVLGRSGNSAFHMNGRARHYNGTDWTTTSATNYTISMVIKHADGTYVGLPISGTAISSPTNAIDIFGNNREGVRMKFGSQVILRGINVFLVKAGTPNNLVVSVYEGSTLKYSGTMPASALLTSTNIWYVIYFTSPVLLTANTNIYIVLSQESNGGTGSNDYGMRVYDINSTYIEAILPPDMRFIYGTGNDPTLYNVETTEVPAIVAIIDDPAVDLDEAKGIIKVGMGGGFNG